MKKLFLILLLFVGVSHFSLAQIHADSLITPSYICQADSFPVTLSGWHGMGGYNLDSLVHTYHNDSLLLKYYFHLNWGPATPTPFRATHKFPLPKPGNYTLYAKRYDDGYYLDNSTAQINVCMGISGTGKSISEMLVEKIYPNPTNGVLFLAGFPKETTIFLTDISGRTLIEKQAAQTQLDLVTFPAGIYFLHTETTNRKMVRKIIKN